MRICLVNVTDDKFLTGAPLNLLFLGSYLIDKNIVDKRDIKIIFYSEQKLLRLIRKFEPQIIGLSINTPFYLNGIKLIKEIKKIDEKIIVVVGGYHFSALPNSIPKECNFGVIGEGEKTFAELVSLIKRNKSSDDKELKKIDSLIFKDKHDNLVINQLRPPLDISHFNKLHWDLVGYENIYSYQAVIINQKAEIKKVAVIYSSRGCPFNCSFCAHRVIWKGVRFFNVEMVCDEMEDLYKKYGIDCFEIMDDTFAVSKKRLKLFINELGKRNLLGKLFFYYLFIRADLIDEEFADLLKQFGAISVFIGVEFGSRRIMKLFKDGNLTIRKAKSACRLFAKKGIMVFSSYMLFNPTEKMEELAKTYQIATWFASQQNSLGIGFSVTTPYPGTKIWPLYAKNRDLKQEKWSNFLMFNENSGARKMSHIFFRNNISLKQCQAIWKKFSMLSTKISDGLESRFSYRRLQKVAEQMNKNKFLLASIKRKCNYFLSKLSTNCSL